MPLNSHGQTIRTQVPLGGSELSLLNRAATSKTTQDEHSAAVELAKLESFKRIVGPTFGPEGAKLANEKRRRGFLDDEDFEDIVETQ